MYIKKQRLSLIKKNLNKNSSLTFKILTVKLINTIYFFNSTFIFLSLLTKLKNMSVSNSNPFEFIAKKLVEHKNTIIHVYLSDKEDASIITNVILKFTNHVVFQKKGDYSSILLNGSKLLIAKPIEFINSVPHYMFVSDTVPAVKWMKLLKEQTASYTFNETSFTRILDYNIKTEQQKIEVANVSNSNPLEFISLLLIEKDTSIIMFIGGLDDTPYKITEDILIFLRQCRDIKFTRICDHSFTLSNGSKFLIILQDNKHCIEKVTSTPKYMFISENVGHQEWIPYMKAETESYNFSYNFNEKGYYKMDNNRPWIKQEFETTNKKEEEQKLPEKLYFGPKEVIDVAIPALYKVVPDMPPLIEAPKTIVAFIADKMHTMHTNILVLVESYEAVEELDEAFKPFAHTVVRSLHGRRPSYPNAQEGNVVIKQLFFDTTYDSLKDYFTPDYIIMHSGIGKYRDYTHSLVEPLLKVKPGGLFLSHIENYVVFERLLKQQKPVLEVPPVIEYKDIASPKSLDDKFKTSSVELVSKMYEDKVVNIVTHPVTHAQIVVQEVVKERVYTSSQIEGLRTCWDMFNEATKEELNMNIDEIIDGLKKYNSLFIKLKALEIEAKVSLKIA